MYPTRILGFFIFSEGILYFGPYIEKSSELSNFKHVFKTLSQT